MKRIEVSRPSSRELEGDIVKAIRLRLAPLADLELMRNGVSGVRSVDAAGSERFHRAGLGRGSADLIGVLRVWIETAAGVMVCVGRFIALEVKQPGKAPRPGRLAQLEGEIARGVQLDGGRLHEYEQLSWMRRVRERGGFAAFVTSASEAEQAIERARRFEHE